MSQRARIHGKTSLESTEWAPILLWLSPEILELMTLKKGSLRQCLTFTSCTWSDCSPGTGQPQLSWQWGQPISNKSKESDLWLFEAGQHILIFLTPSDRSHSGPWGCGMALRQAFPPRASPQAQSSEARKRMVYSRVAGEKLQGCSVPGTDRCTIMLTYPPSPHRAGAWSNLFISSYQL